MKKLMIAAMIVSIAAISQAAASFNWGTKSALAGSLYDGSTTTKAGSGTLVYLFDAATLSQKDAYDAFIAGTLDTVMKTKKPVEDSSLDSNSRIAKVTGIEYGSSDSKYDMYWIALIGADKLYISSIMEDKSPLDVGGFTLEWDDVRATSNNGVKTAWDSAATSHAGVYGAAVPEPTSAMLLLLGMAGLALRRRRA